MDKSQKNFFLLIICILGPFLILLLFDVSNVYYLSDAKNMVYLRDNVRLVNVLTLVATVIALMSLYRFTNVFKSEIREKHLEESIRQYEGLMQNVSKQRHDFNNHIQMVCALIEMEQFQNAKDYVYSIISSNSLTNEVLRSNNVEISALLHSKLGLAESMGIQMDICLNGDFRSLPIEPMEITSILGNLIDNAIDALGNMSLKERKISLSIDRNKYSLLISISNHIEVKVKESSKYIFKKGFSTKGSSGLGLYIVKEIVEKHSGRIESSISSDTITFTIIIPIINNINPAKSAEMGM